MRDTELDLIRRLPMFREAQPEYVTELVAGALLQRFPPHVLLIEEGHLPDFLHIIVEGCIELFASHAGRESILEIIQPGAAFILAAVVRDEVYLSSARTLSPARILMIPAASVRKVFGADAAFARAIVAELAGRYRSIVRALKNERLRTSAERVANFALLADRLQGGTGRVALAYDKRTLASQLGMTPENLSRSLALLAAHGVATRGREIVIEDREALVTFAQPNPLIDDLGT